MSNVGPRSVASTYNVDCIDQRFNYGCGYASLNFHVIDISKNTYMTVNDIAYKVAFLYGSFIVKKLIIVMDELTVTEYYGLGSDDKETMKNLQPAPQSQAQYMRHALKDLARTGQVPLGFTASTNFKEKRVRFNRNNRIRYTYYPKCKKYVTTTEANLTMSLQNQLILMGCVNTKPVIYIGWGPLQILPGQTDGTRAVQKIISGRIRIYTQYQFAERKITNVVTLTDKKPYNMPELFGVVSDDSLSQ